MVFPEIRVFQWNTDEIASPVGTRHLPGGSFAYKQRVSLGCGAFNSNKPGTTSGALLFEGTRFDVVNGAAPSHDESIVAAITFNLANSGVGVSDLRLYLVDDTALVQPATDRGIDPAFVQITTSGTWLGPQPILPSGAGTRLTRSIPFTANVRRQDGQIGLVGQDDVNSSQFVYMNLILPFGFPLGDFGICGSGALRFGLIFNYFPNDHILQFG
jgi:hypothetical protein